LKVSVFSPKAGHFVTAFEDYSEYIRKMEEQKLTREKFELLCHISRHDILNQMMVINGISDVLRIKNNPERLATSLDSIRDASEKIDRILQFGKEYVEIGNHNAEWIDIYHAVSRISSSFDQVKIDIDHSLDGVSVYADPMIERVFFNLIDNAIRHGGRTTEIKVGRSDTADEVIITVEDNGFGISDEQKGRLFQYGQGNSSGFGLYLCKEILQITGLTIIETGRPGIGARFEVHIPLEKTETFGNGSMETLKNGEKC
jgi:signal transduction histidine kinase